MKNTVECGVRLGLSGRFKLTKFSDPERACKTGETPWFNNIITNNGLDLFGECSSLINTTTPIGALRLGVVGTGTQTPSAGQTALEQQIAFSTSGTVNSSVNSSERYVSYVRNINFGEGEAAGNISEVGIGGFTNSLFSRQLVRDEQGNPTTITVLSNEFLTLTYELRINQYIEDIEVITSGLTFTIRPAQVDNAVAWTGVGAAYFSPASSNRGWYVSSSTLQSITSAPSIASANRATGGSLGAYAQGSYTRTAEGVWPIDRGNININSLMVHFGPGCWQLGLSDTQTKNNTMELRVVFRITWAREGELPE